MGVDPRRAGAVPRARARRRRPASVRDLDERAADRRRGGVGPYGPGTAPERRAAPGDAGDVARGAAGPCDRRRRPRHHHGDRGAARAGRCAAGISRSRRTGRIPPALESRAARHRVLPVRGGGRRRLRRCHAARHPRPPRRRRHQGGHTRLGDDLPADRGLAAESPRQGAHHGRGSILRLLGDGGCHRGTDRHGRRAPRDAGRAAGRVARPAVGAIRHPFGAVRPAGAGDVHRADGGLHPPHAVGGGGRRRHPGARPATIPGGRPCRTAEREAVEQVVADARAARA